MASEWITLVETLISDGVKSELERDILTVTDDFGKEMVAPKTHQVIVEGSSMIMNPECRRYGIAGEVILRDFETWPCNRGFIHVVTSMISSIAFTLRFRNCSQWGKIIEMLQDKDGRAIFRAIVFAR